MWERMKVFINHAVTGMAAFMPQHVVANDNDLVTGMPRDDAVKFAGKTFDGNRLIAASQQMQNDNACGGAFARVFVLLADGSGTLTHTSSDAQEKILMYCYWKKANMARWYIVTDAMGWIFFVSPPYPGKVSDDTALDLTQFNTWLTSCVSADGRVTENGAEIGVVAVGGDKGYVDTAVPDGYKLALTLSAAEGEDLGERAKNGRKKSNKVAALQKRLGENAILHESFATYRSVIERVIGYMKHMSCFVEGPVYGSQTPWLAAVLLVVASLSNWRLSLNPHVFVKDDQQ